MEKKDRKTRDELEKLQAEFKSAQAMLIALGDENRQHILRIMLTESDKEEGLRAAELAEKANFSRPAALHHLQILMKAGLIKKEKRGRESTMSLQQTKKRCLI